MSDDQHPDLDALQATYTQAVDSWIASIEAEKRLVTVTPHSIAEVDRWEAAHFDEEDARKKVKAAKEVYEGALRTRFFNF